jgi:hypothetical protein
MAGSKRSRSSEDPPPQRQVRPRSSAQAPSLPTPSLPTPSLPTPSLPTPSLPTPCLPTPSLPTPGLPTPDDALSVADSSISLPAEKKVPAGPANPGVVRKRDEGVLSRLPPDCDAEQEFGRLRRDSNLTDAEAFMKFIRTYDVPMDRLHQISGSVYPIPLHRHLICVASLVYIPNIIDDLQS